ncbi:hypothetical protein WJU23_02430 [Prosthecobacter sp. SYSU 5D2]|uniref:hypothetical protein n=1 Tax=Prosthecobacter sp. SYSU 5D2 TaxID=3134134 RepID=UPI0031FE5DB4
MIDTITDEITESWMLGRDSSITEEELLLLRNRLWISWGIWLLASLAISAALAGVTGFYLVVGAFFAFQLTRLMRAYRRPKLRHWHIRKHLYNLTYFLPPIIAGIGLGQDGAPVSSGNWLAFFSTLYFLFWIQMKDDLKILKAIPQVLQFLRAGNPEPSV